MASANATGSYNTIKVVARFRPPNKIEVAHGGQPIVNFETEDTCNLSTKDAAGAFTFDRVFDSDSQQSDVFDFSIRNTVDDILNGYNGTVFAYGQTGAGKSYTMMGSDIDDTDGKGIIPRIVEQIFSNIMTSPGNIEYTVRVSYMEIYMERIRDLLQPQNDNLPIHEEKNRGVYVKGLLEIYVSSVAEVFEVMRRGGTARAVAATNMNQESSRSHSIFVITITQKNVETGSAKSGQLFLVDLAGSEKVGKTGASGQTLEEAKKINKSLSALGMVINSLTDGKSTHIPYRDSKLTRILQESLGGNSRTTLIINCSPSSYNVEETLSTLRFGVRAKAIKNKAKVNAELSPAELKALLRKAQTQATTYENYISNLESEVKLWRGGESVPQDRWAQPRANEAVAAARAEAKPRAGNPSLGTETPRPDTPSQMDRLVERAATPTVALEKDEREDFLRRENELQDQIAEKESSLAEAERNLQEVKEELKHLKDSTSNKNRENEQLGGEVNELKLQLERIAFEGKEASITMDGLKEANSELTTELDEIKQQLLDARMSAKEATAMLDEKEKKKADRMAQMMAGFDIGDEAASENEARIKKCIQEAEALYEASASGEAVPPEKIDELKSQLAELQLVVRNADVNLSQKFEFEEDQARRREAIETRLAAVQKEYEELLEGKLPAEDVTEMKARLEKQYAAGHESEVTSAADLKADLARAVAENKALQAKVSQTPATNGSASQSSVISPSSKTLQQQIADFDVMKKSLMRDLQNRCERVVELEISLDETREQYNNVLKTSNNRAQQKKMAFLERNLEQLTHVQRQLVEQNSSLKKEVAIAERKLIARNDRILSLEALLGDSQEKLTAANHRFEAQLAAVKERLEAAKTGAAARGLAMSPDGSGSGGGSGAGFGGFSFGGGSRIAKPLRGGGAAPNIPTLSNLQAQEKGEAGSGTSPAAKRSSWFFNPRN